MAYATPSEFEDYSADTTDNLLARASAFIDSKLVGAVYDTDDDGVAIEPTIKDAIAEATLAQAAYWNDGYGSPHGPPVYSTVSIATVTLTTNPQSSSGRKDVIAPLAYAALRSAGLLPIYPQNTG